jgi:hypothetical protein
MKTGYVGQGFSLANKIEEAGFSIRSRGIVAEGSLRFRKPVTGN